MRWWWWWVRGASLGGVDALLGLALLEGLVLDLAELLRDDLRRHELGLRHRRRRLRRRAALAGGARRVEEVQQAVRVVELDARQRLRLRPPRRADRPCRLDHFPVVVWDARGPPLRGIDVASQSGESGRASAADGAGTDSRGASSSSSSSSPAAAGSAAAAARAAAAAAWRRPSPAAAAAAARLDLPLVVCSSTSSIASRPATAAPPAAAAARRRGGRGRRRGRRRGGGGGGGRRGGRGDGGGRRPRVQEARRAAEERRRPSASPSADTIGSRPWPSASGWRSRCGGARGGP